MLLPVVTSDAAWATVAVLGVYHGIDPAVGWLVAVSRGMQERSRRAVLRSLVPSTAHGAGLMIAPVILGLRASQGGHDDMAMLSGGPIDIAAVGLAVHVAAMIVVMGAIAFFVYERVGLQVLRRAWLNTDQVWAGAFILAGLVTLTG
jgi:hypothetical protein